MIDPSLPSAQRQPAQRRAIALPHEDRHLDLALEAQAGRFYIKAAELMRSRTMEPLETLPAIADDDLSWAGLAQGRPPTRTGWPTWVP